jgi:hypothetical protein
LRLTVIAQAARPLSARPAATGAAAKTGARSSPPLLPISSSGGLPWVASGRVAAYARFMAHRLCCLPGHDLMLHLVAGEHSSEEAIEFAQLLDETCASRWLCYYHPSVTMDGMDVARIPAVRRAVEEKRKQLFGDKPKAYALACTSKASKPYFDFWRRYDSEAGRAFQSLDEAYDFLGLSGADRAAADAAIRDFEAEVDATPAAR